MIKFYGSYDEARLAREIRDRIFSRINTAYYGGVEYVVCPSGEEKYLFSGDDEEEWVEVE